MGRRWARPAALSSPVFRQYAASQLASSAALTCQRVAELWLVLEITGNALSLGVSTALRTAPSLLLAGAGGALADRFDRRTLLACTQGGKAVVGGAFAWLVAGGEPAIETVYGLVLTLGCLNALDAPIRRAAVREVVGPEDLAGAARLHTATISTARVIGGLLAGLLIAWSGVPAAFAFGAAASAAAAIGFRTLRFPEPAPASETNPEADRGFEADPDPEADPGSGRETVPDPEADRGPEADPGLKDDPGPEDASPAAAGDRGLLARIWSPTLRPAFLFLAVFSIIGWNIDVLIPLLAEAVLGGGATTYGVLVTCVSIGSLTGSVAAASWRPAARTKTESTTEPNSRTGDRLAAEPNSQIENRSATEPNSRTENGSATEPNGRTGDRSATKPSGGIADLTRSLLVFSAVLATVAATPSAVPVAASLTLAGFTGGLFLSLVNAAVQLGADQALQGRQVAVYTFVFIGSRALGAPFIGLTADWIGPRPAVITMAAATAALALLVQAAFTPRHPVH